MTSQLSNCPCCDEDELFLTSYALENGQLHYKVVCHSCGVEFHHGDFYGYNSVMKFFEDAGRGDCENEGDTMNFLCSKCGCDVSGGDELGHNSNKGAFNFCPNCGAEVQR